MKDKKILKKEWSMKQKQFIPYHGHFSTKLLVFPV
jgi:hypothetical protein